MCNTVRLLTLASVVVLLTGCPSATPPNQPPNADAGPDQAVAGGTVVTLDASGSQDADGGALQFSWTQSAGPTAGLTNPNTANPTLRAPNQTATLRYAVQVTDGGGLSDTDSVSIQVTFADNVPPISFSQDIQPILSVFCANCHVAGGIADNAGIDLLLVAGQSYDGLVNKESVQDPSLTFVVPGDSSQSLLWMKVGMDNPPVGRRMPFLESPLDEASIELILRWIDDGALDN